MELYVNNLAPGTSEAQLKELFEAFGEVTNVKLSATSFTKFNKGNGFVRMPNRSEAENAKAALHGTSLNGKKITVDVARF